MHRRIASVLVAAVAAVGVGAASPAVAADLVTQPSCAEPAEVAVFVPGGVPLADWRENLEVGDDGTVWVSHATSGRVEAFDRDGRLRSTVEVPSPGGIRRGTDGLMYVNYGLLPGSADSGIMRFDPAAEHPEAEVFVGGLSGINGLAIDGAGNFYLSREFAPTILKLRPDGTKDEAWTEAADVFGTNGLSVQGGVLYAGAITNPLSPVERVPLDDPGGHTTVARLSEPPMLYKGLDDLEAVGDHLYVTAFAAGELLRVDKRSGETCVLVGGLRQPTSVRDGTGNSLFVSEASGRVLRIAAAT